METYVYDQEGGEFLPAPELPAWVRDAVENENDVTYYEVVEERTDRGDAQVTYRKVDRQPQDLPHRMVQRKEDPYGDERVTLYKVIDIWKVIDIRSSTNRETPGDKRVSFYKVIDAREA